MPKSSKVSDVPANARFEYRVWGKQGKARKALGRLATEESEEHTEDCYLLVDDPTWNAKVRGSSLKVKQLIDEDLGFERWVARREPAPEAKSPFDDLFDDLDLDRLRASKPKEVAAAIDKLDPDLGVRAVFVTKHRVHYRVGELRAEVTDIEIVETGEVLQTLAIEGDDLDELVALREKLGLRKEPNTPVHQAIDAELDSD